MPVGTRSGRVQDPIEQVGSISQDEEQPQPRRSTRRKPEHAQPPARGRKGKRTMKTNTGGTGRDLGTTENVRGQNFNKRKDQKPIKAIEDEVVPTSDEAEVKPNEVIDSVEDDKMSTDNVKDKMDKDIASQEDDNMEPVSPGSNGSCKAGTKEITNLERDENMNMKAVEEEPVQHRSKSSVEQLSDVSSRAEPLKSTDGQSSHSGHLSVKSTVAGMVQEVKAKLKFPINKNVAGRHQCQRSPTHPPAFDDRYSVVVENDHADQSEDEMQDESRDLVNDPTLSIEEQREYLRSLSDPIKRYPLSTVLKIGGMDIDSDDSSGSNYLETQREKQRKQVQQWELLRRSGRNAENSEENSESGNDGILKKVDQPKVSKQKNNQKSGKGKGKGKGKAVNKVEVEEEAGEAGSHVWQDEEVYKNAGGALPQELQGKLHSARTSY